MFGGCRALGYPPTWAETGREFQVVVNAMTLKKKEN